MKPVDFSKSVKATPRLRAKLLNAMEEVFDVAPTYLAHTYCWKWNYFFLLPRLLYPSITETL